jgi:hypothetical protein
MIFLPNFYSMFKALGRKTSGRRNGSMQSPASLDSASQSIAMAIFYKSAAKQLLFSITASFSSRSS